MTDAPSNIGGIVLCGGQSSRMGRPKHLLPFGDRTMLQVVVRTLQQVVDPVVVVRAAGQQLPPLPENVLVTEDEEPDLGPLAGLSAGLNALSDGCRAAYATSCDVPLLRPEVVQFMAAAIPGYDAAVIREGKFYHVLAGVYSTALLPRIRELLTARRLRPFFLIEECNTRVIDVEEIRPVDPDLRSFRNVNTPEDYAAVLKTAGLTD